MNKVFALCVGEKTTTRAQFLYRDSSSDPLTMGFYFWVVVSPDGPIVVDCGFGPGEAERRSVERYRDRRELLAACGVVPNDVRYVFVTHLHYDHWAGYELFPNATFFIQAREIEFWRGPGRQFSIFTASANLDAIDAIGPMERAGRVRIVDSDWTVTAGLGARLMSGHTPGMQTLSVETASGSVLIASDTFHFYENLSQRKPVQVTVDMLEAVRSMEQIEQTASVNPELLLPGHDLLVLRRFPTIAPGVARIA